MSKTSGSGCLKNQGQSYRLNSVQTARLFMKPFFGPTQPIMGWLSEITTRGSRLDTVTTKGGPTTHATVEWLWLQEGPIFKQSMPIPKSWLVLHIVMTLFLLWQQRIMWKRIQRSWHSAYTRGDDFDSDANKGTSKTWYNRRSMGEMEGTVDMLQTSERHFWNL